MSFMVMRFKERNHLRHTDRFFLKIGEIYKWWISVSKEVTKMLKI